MILFHEKNFIVRTNMVIRLKGWSDCTVSGNEFYKPSQKKSVNIKYLCWQVMCLFLFFMLLFCSLTHFVFNFKDCVTKEHISFLKLIHAHFDNFM